MAKVRQCDALLLVLDYLISRSPRISNGILFISKEERQLRQLLVLVES